MYHRTMPGHFRSVSRQGRGKADAHMGHWNEVVGMELPRPGGGGRNQTRLASRSPADRSFVGEKQKTDWLVAGGGARLRIPATGWTPLQEKSFPASGASRVGAPPAAKMADVSWLESFGGQARDRAVSFTHDESEV